jgi:UDP-N-acetylmuramoylalanine--D-glutamate ligase
MKICGETIAIIGCGETGFNLSPLLKSMGAIPSVFDKSSNEELIKKAEILNNLGVPVYLGGYSFEDLAKFNLIILSPGVDPTKSPVPELSRGGKIVMGELELIFKLTKTPFIGITGTNGKTTTTRLTAHLLGKDNRKHVIGGNIPGASLASRWEEINTAEFIVCEISSFQLEGIIDFRPKIACYLNISPDHIDRYPDFESYFKAKNRIFMNMKEDDFLIMNYEDNRLRSLEDKIEANLFYFSSTREVPRGSFCSGKKIIFRDDKTDRVVTFLNKVSLPGIHNLENILASITVSMIIDVKESSVQAGLDDFKLAEHTLEFVAEIDGVKYINDSKGTNVDSVIRALNSFEEQIILLAGGKDKGCEYSQLNPHLLRRAKMVILFGEAREIMAKALSKDLKIVMVKNMEDGIIEAMKSSSKGDLVLLSPACSSFDQFKNYAQRGEVFRKCILSIKEQKDERHC